MNSLISWFDQAWLHPIQMTVALAGAAVVWLLGRAQSIGDIRKLQAEVISLRVNQFEKIIVLDEKQRNIVERLYAQLRVLFDAMHRQDADTARSARESAQQIFLLEYIGAYFHYVSIGRWVFPEARYELVDDEILPFLETSAMLLESLNQPELLQLTGQPPVVVNEFDFNFAFRFVRKHTNLWEWKRKQRVRQLEKQLGFKKTGLDE